MVYRPNIRLARNKKVHDILLLLCAIAVPSSIYGLLETQRCEMCIVLLLLLCVISPAFPPQNNDPPKWVLVLVRVTMHSWLTLWCWCWRNYAGAIAVRVSCIRIAVQVLRRDQRRPVLLGRSLCKQRCGLQRRIQSCWRKGLVDDCGNINTYSLSISRHC